jgi:hypothetical protein
MSHTKTMESQATNSNDAEKFVERRGSDVSGQSPIVERRQFSNSHNGLTPDAAELARAIDQYKLVHRRRFIDFEEMLTVIKSLGYHK